MLQLVLLLVICHMCLYLYSYLYSVVDMTPTKELVFFFFFDESKSWNSLQYEGMALQ